LHSTPRLRHTRRAQGNDGRFLNNNNKIINIITTIIIIIIIIITQQNGEGVFTERERDTLQMLTALL
jgi:hypothetical protein